MLLWFLGDAVDFRLSSCHYSPNTGNVSGVLKEHNGTIRTVKFLASSTTAGEPQSLLFASAGGGDCKTRLWDAQSGNLYTFKI